MPPYSRLMAASAAAAWNEANARGGRPNSASVLSTNANPAPNSSVSTVAAAVEMTLWPLVYSGKGGVCSRGRPNLARRIQHERPELAPVGLDRVHVGGRRGHPTAGGGRDRVLRVASGLQVVVLRRPRENVLRHPLAVRDGAFEDGPRDAQAPEPLVHGGPERIHPRPRERERPAHGEKRVHPGQG